MPVPCVTRGSHRSTMPNGMRFHCKYFINTLPFRRQTRRSPIGRNVQLEGTQSWRCCWKCPGGRILVQDYKWAVRICATRRCGPKQWVVRTPETITEPKCSNIIHTQGGLMPRWYKRQRNAKECMARRYIRLDWQDSAAGDLCQSVSSVASRQHRRSASRGLLVVPRHRLSSYGRWAFSVACPAIWNWLPDSLRDPAISRDSFKRSLKTFLFSA